MRERRESPQKTLFLFSHRHGNKVSSTGRWFQCIFPVQSPRASPSTAPEVLIRSQKPQILSSKSAFARCLRSSSIRAVKQCPLRVVAFVVLLRPPADTTSINTRKRVPQNSTLVSTPLLLQFNLFSKEEVSSIPRPQNFLFLTALCSLFCNSLQINEKMPLPRGSSFLHSSSLDLNSCLKGRSLQLPSRIFHYRRSQLCNYWDCTAV